MKFKKIQKKVLLFVKKEKLVILFLLILLAFHLFFRFYELEKRAQFTWDQVDNAWHAKNIIINHQFPLIGMPAKQNASVSIGPAYYYFVTFFYLLTNLDPIASPIIAGVVGIISFFVLFLVTKKIFNVWVGLIALFINTFSFYLITMDRIQWPVELIAPIGLLIFMSLYEISKGKVKYILFLAFLLGLSLHVHFTSIFYLPIVCFALPLFPRRKETILYILGGIPLFGVWLIPFVISFFQKTQSMNIISFLTQNSVGFHLRHVLQVAPTAFLEQTLIWGSNAFDILKYFTVPIFICVYYFANKKRKYGLLYLTIIWFIVPWVGLSLFNGELTPYYFAITRYLGIVLVAYILYTAIIYRKIVFLPIFSVLAILFIVLNISQFFTYKTQGITELKQITYKNFKESRGNEFIYGAAQSYIYYYYEYKAWGQK